MIPVNTPIISDEAKNYVNDALNTGWISSAGPYIEKLEKEFAKFIGVKHAIAVSNGTAAIHTALMALGISKSDEVIVPAFTMGSSWLAVIHAGARPVFVDCRIGDYNIDPDLIQAKITSRTRAIMPVHIYGHPADMDSIIELAEKHNLYIIEDAAEAHGAEYRGRKCGSFGDINCFSLYANKIITSGEGGIITTDSDTLDEESRKFRDLYHSDTRFIHEKIGYNYRITNLQAALALGQLEHVEEYVSKKINMAKRYHHNLRSINSIILPKSETDIKHVHWMYAVRLENDNQITKDQVRKRLFEKGIDTRDFFYPPSSQPALEPYIDKSSSYPITDLISRTGFYLPSGLALTDSEIDKVSEVLISVLEDS